jgi:hypothetical protein
MLLLMAQKDPQEELNSDSKLRSFFSSWPIPHLCTADKSVHFTRFSVNLVPSVYIISCQNHSPETSKFVTQTDLKYIHQPVLHIVIVTIWSTSRRMYFKSVSTTNLNMSHVIVILLLNIFVDLTEQLAQSNSEYSLLFCLPWINNSEI